MNHTCDICGKTGPWTDDWQWYGSYLLLDFYGRKAIIITCSDTCRRDESMKDRRSTQLRDFPTPPRRRILTG